MSLLGAHDPPGRFLQNSFVSPSVGTKVGSIEQILASVSPLRARTAERLYCPAMSFDAQYEPSTWGWVAEQVTEYEASGGTKANTLRDTGIPIIIVTCVGHKSGKVRKVPLMRVERDGAYAVIASKGGAPDHPGWYHNLMADPSVQIQDGPEPFDARVRLIDGDERASWWAQAVEVYPPYADYAEKADREIPVFVAEAV